ncbi:hypothetical protein BOTNAR_0523g00020 [Botryotinia narcissicola]|uniref:RBR-type E3 ubiquitin transferase n=1 Tax=Botryotinia narcissicola TaxID=278944 RepID=A0A4Z1HE90_9HELO|nr:hypothetical protein BOTNAR_0523g00020 [Botryotinia narcissicola]
MAFDYQSSKVFGLNFKEHDARKMRHVLKHYGKLPENQGDRLALFLRLQTFETSLDEEVSGKVKEWFENGGDLPSTHPVTAPAEESSGEGGEDEANEDKEEDSDEEEGSDDDSSSDSGASANSGHELQWEDRERALRRHPGMDIFDLFPQRDCRHPDTLLCRECLDLSITTDIEYGLLIGIKCPLCSAVLTDHDILCKASLGVVNRYSYLREKASRPDTFVMCLGPKCGGGQIHEGPEPLMVCDHCKFKTCVKHKLPWHQGQSCDEFDVDDSQIERLEQDEATAKLLAKDSRICPKCKECVVRSDGCDHMECRCGNSWCYLCGADWENILRLGGAAHGRNCPNNPDSLSRTRSQNLANETALTNLVHGGPVNEAQTRAKYAKQAARREAMRPLALAAAEQRMKEQALAKSDSDTKSGPPKKRTKLVSAWEEK